MRFLSIFFAEKKILGKIIFQLSAFYHCDAMRLYNTPISEIFDLVNLLNEGHGR